MMSCREVVLYVTVDVACKSDKAPYFDRGTHWKEICALESGFDYFAVFEIYELS